MRTAIVAFILACLIAVLLTPVIRRFALARRLFDDHMAARKVHGRPIPRLGGVAIVAGFYAPLMALMWWSSGVGQTFYSIGLRAKAFLLGGVVIVLLGLYDDLRGAGAGKKFLVQFLVAIALYSVGFHIEWISLPMIGSLALGHFSIVFTVLWIVGVINALNLIDGLDGLAAGVAFFAVLTTFIIAANHGDPIMMLFMGALAGALLGFLVYNFNPASIFMGDSGSMFLGYVLAVGSIETSQKATTTVAILVPIMALGLPITDTLLAMVRRGLQHKPLFSADRAHIHHRLLDMGMSHRRAVLVLYGASALLCTIALILTFASNLQSALILLATLGLVIAAIRFLGYGRKLSAVAEKLGPEINSQLIRLGGTKDETQMWRELKKAARKLGIASLRMTLRARREEDALLIERSHGPWLEADIPTGTLDVEVDDLSVVVDFLCAAPLTDTAKTALQEALVTACGRINNAEQGSNTALAVHTEAKT